MIMAVPHLGCIMTDLDRFGRYNNAYGHQQGDIALKTVAGVVQRLANTEYVARYGGEEFSIILAGYNTSKRDISTTADTIRKTVESSFIPPFDTDAIIDLYKEHTKHGRRFAKEMKTALTKNYADRHSYVSYTTELIKDVHTRKFLHGLQNVTVSIGIAIRKPDESVNHLIYRTDKALYASKEAGRNCVTLAR